MWCSLARGKHGFAAREVDHGRKEDVNVREGQPWMENLQPRSQVPRTRPMPDLLARRGQEKLIVRAARLRPIIRQQAVEKLPRADLAIDATYR